MKQARKTDRIPLYPHMKTLSFFSFFFVHWHFHKTLFHKDMRGYLLNYHYLHDFEVLFTFPKIKYAT